MYSFDDVFDRNHPMHRQQPWIQSAVCSFMRGLQTQENGGFPSTFARGAISRKSLYFVFADSVTAGPSREAVRASLSQYLSVWKTLPKAEEHLHVLLIFFKPQGTEHTLESYQRKFWTLMADWIEHDPVPWPSDVPTDPNSPFWSMC